MGQFIEANLAARDVEVSVALAAAGFDLEVALDLSAVVL